MTQIIFRNSLHPGYIKLLMTENKHDMEKNPTLVVKKNHDLSPFLLTFII